MLPKSFPNPSKIEKNRPKTPTNRKMAQDACKKLKKSEKMTKNGPTWPQELPKRTVLKMTPGLRVPLSGPYLESKTL